MGGIFTRKRKKVKRLRKFLAWQMIVLMLLGNLSVNVTNSIAATTETTSSTEAEGDEEEKETSTNTEAASEANSISSSQAQSSNTDRLRTNQARAPSQKSSGRDVSSNITSLTVSKSHVNDGERIEVKFNFDDHAVKMQEGDQISVKWTGSSTVFAEGYQLNKDLYIDGVNVGTLQITQNSAVVSFNKNIEDLDNVNGWASFEILGRNVTNTTSESIGTVRISSGSKYNDIEITKPKSGDSGSGGNPFYYKTGDMLPSDTDHVRWFLCVNNTKDQVIGDTKLLDQIQPGQKLDTSSFKITVSGRNNDFFYGDDAISKFEAAYPGSEIKVDGQNINVVLPERHVSRNNIVINYKTSIIDYNQKKFTNNSQAWYQISGDSAVAGKDFNFQVTNVNADGGVDGSNRTSVSVKKDWVGDDKSDRPESIKVQLYADGYPTGDPVTLTAADGWKYTWDKLVKAVHGNKIAYTVKEVNVPDGYESSVSNTGNDFTITNKQAKKVTVSGQKSWKDNDDQDGLRPDSITVHLLADGEEINSQKVTAADKWQYSFDNLPEYKDGKKIAYSIKEDAVKGYDSQVDGYDVTNTHQPETTAVLGQKTWV
ncbi:Cna B-type domain-containing protein, partial [Lactobacillus sp.]|uniref:Cna B-type domain-containing protein n=1 Tax=Lactobacillus sp. TaxID=1591 RepID=UPI003F061CDE